MTTRIRTEKKDDRERTGLIIRRAFEAMPYSDGGEEALVGRLRRRPGFIPDLSLVAETDGETAGHILFTAITISGDAESFPSLALAPLSVLPELQGKGIGTALVKEGLSRARALGFSSVIVLGEPEYYHRFGFRYASLWGIEPPPGLPHDYFLALELEAGGLSGVSGVVEYPKEFSGV